MGAYQVQYGSVVFPYTKLACNVEPLTAEDDATFMGVTYHFTVSGTLAGASAADFAAKVNAFRCQLTQPRKSFVVRTSDDGGVTWQTLFNFKGGVAADAYDYGPKPCDIDISNWAGGLAASYRFSLRVTTRECFNSDCTTVFGTNLPDHAGVVLSLSAGYSHSVSADGFTTRTVSGRLTVAGNAAAQGKPGDYFRYFTAPKVPANFKRVHQSFVQSPDNRHLDYSITDQEVMWTLPTPVSDGSASFTVHVRELGGLIDYHLSGRFSAPASVGKDAILQRIGELLQSKFPSDQNPGFIWRSRSVTEDVYGNAVQFAFSAQCAGIPGDPTAATAAANWLAGFGGTPPGSDGKSQFIGPYGGDGQNVSSGVKAGNFSAPYDACTGLGGLDNNTSLAQNLPTSVLVPGDNNTPTSSQTPQGGSQAPQLSQDHYAAPYIAYHEVYSFMGDNGTVAMIPKVKGANPIVTQVRTPSLKVIQSGYCVRDCPDPSTAPVPPAPFGGNAGVELLKWEIRPSVPEPLGAGNQLRYTLHWTYVGQWLKSIEKGVNTLELAYPNDPRVTADQTKFPDTIPELVVIPV